MADKKQSVHTYYQVDYKKNTLKRTHKSCPRCKGSFLAKHKDRQACGLCGYTEF